MTSNFTVPNLFVIGAAKAATSSLQRWLGDHPQIGTSSVEETRFLMDASDPLSRPDGYAATGLEGYAKYFPPERRRGDIRHAIDVTPMYYYQKTAREVIPSLPEARVIFIARRPSTRLKSLYDFAQNNIGALPKGITFAEFVAEMEKGAGSDIIGKYTMMANGIAHCRYADYLESWIAAMGAERVRILLFEDLVRDSRAVLNDLAGDLQIDRAFYDGYAFPRENQSFQVHNPSLHKVARLLRQRLPYGTRQWLKTPYMWMNIRRGKAEATAEDSAAMARIDMMLADSNRKLGDLLQRDISWN